MNVHTPSDQVKAKAGLITAITAAANNGTVIDTLGFENALVVFHSAPSGVGTTSDCKIQEGAASNLSDAADVADAVFPQVTTAGGTKIETMDIRLSKRKRYLRAVHTGAGGAAAGQAAVTFYLFNARNFPVTQDVTPVTV